MIDHSDVQSSRQVTLVSAKTLGAQATREADQLLITDVAKVTEAAPQSASALSIHPSPAQDMIRIERQHKSSDTFRLAAVGVHCHTIHSEAS